MVKRRIHKVAVIGSGTMGSAIACQFANIGVEVLLLDIPDKSSSYKNKIVDESLRKSINLSPSPLYRKAFASRISTGNFEDDFHKISDSQWIIEVVVENLEIKKQVFEHIEKYRSSQALVTSNTSGIPIASMGQGRSSDFLSHFAITHFFNPPRYLKLVEIVPSQTCSPEVVKFLMSYTEKFLGKMPVLAKDTPGFIANRIGIYNMLNTYRLAKELGFSVEEIDNLTGLAMGRPKSATFRTCDVVGIDTLAFVSESLYQSCENDECRDVFKIDSTLSKMIENKWLGSKTKQGFYKKDGEVISSLDFKTLSYNALKKSSFPILERAKELPLIERYALIIEGSDKVSEFYRKNFGDLFAYVQNRIPEISDDAYCVDNALKAGFGWQHGPFEIWQSIGVAKGIELIESRGQKVAGWVTEMLEKGHTFYATKLAKTRYYAQSAKAMSEKPEYEGFIILDKIREASILWSNDEAAIHNLGDGVLNLEFRSKMNTIGEGVIAAINRAIDMAEESYEALVIANQAENFSVGANLFMVYLAAVEQEYALLEQRIKLFQDTMMRVRYSAIPVVVAPHGFTFGGACELTLHADAVVASAETYAGLVEFGVGLIPGGGGTKELTLLASDRYLEGDTELNTYRHYFLNIAMSKVSTSGHEAIELGFLKNGRDLVVVNDALRIGEAKKKALQLASVGYTKPIQKTAITVLGQQSLGMFLVGTNAMLEGNYISSHDQKIANKIAYVMSGGDLSERSAVSEQYLLDLEREAFMSLCSERKTIERIEYMLKKGKPLRN